MTPEEINKEIAEKVMGVKTQDSKDGLSLSYNDALLAWLPAPSYSTNIQAAWQVVEEMREKGYVMYMRSEPSGKWACRLVPTGDVYRPSDISKYQALYADTAPMAICLAALKTKV